MSQALRLTPTGMTAEEFLRWPGDGRGRRWQLIDGEPVAMAPASFTHGALLAEIVGRLRDHLRVHRPDCRVVVEPGVRPWADRTHNVRVPDFAVVRGPNPSRFAEAPLLAGEILSPSNARETREAVQAYLLLPSVREVAILGSETIGAELLLRDADGVWPREPQLVGRDETLRLESIGYACGMAELYAGILA